MRHLFVVVCAVALALGSVMPAAAQNQAFDAQFGATPWAQNNVRTASAYNWIIDNSTGQYPTFTFPSVVCTQALNFGGRGSLNPFTAPLATGPTQATPNITVFFNDATAANNETVALNAVGVLSGGFCTLSIANLNAHLAYKMSSGTCGAQEAVNDLAASGGGIVEYTQESVALGCPSVSTITGLKNGVGTVFVHDISNGNNQWYALRPSNNTLIAAPSAPTGALASGGALTAGAYLLAQECLDFMGNKTLASTDSSTVTTVAGTQTIVFTPAACAAGSAGYMPMITAAAGGGGTEIDVANPLTSTICTQSVLVGTIFACKLGTNATITANPSATSKEVAFGTAHTAFVYAPMGSWPTPFQTSYLPFTQVATVTSSATNVAQAFIPAGLLNVVGRAVDVCFKANYTIAATGVPTFTLAATPNFGQSLVTLSNLGFATVTATVNGNGCFTIQTATTGTSGTVWGSAIGAQESNAATNAALAGADQTTAVSSAIDLTKPLYLQLQAACATANCTNLTVNNLQIKPHASN